MLRIEKQRLCHRRQLSAGSIPARRIRRNLSYKKRKKGKGGAMENPVKIIRYSKAVKFDDGVETNVQCMGGTMEEVRERAEQIAKENGVEVEIII